MKNELEKAKSNFAKAQVSIQRYESQMSLFDRESRENAQKVKQLELDLVGCQKKLNEANNTISRHQQEILSLEDELNNKNETLKQFKADFEDSTSEMNFFTKQVQDLQEKLKRVEEERDLAVKEKENAKKGLEKVENQLRINQTLSSPRNSLDILESKLLKELGHAHKRVTDLEKQTNLSHGERDQLINQARKTSQDLMVS
jgi:chromosome segregation ATPase